MRLGGKFNDKTDIDRIKAVRKGRTWHAVVSNGKNWGGGHGQTFESALSMARENLENCPLSIAQTLDNTHQLS